MEPTSLLKVFAKNICEAQLVKAFYLVGIFELVRFSYKLNKKKTTGQSVVSSISSSIQ